MSRIGKQKINKSSGVTMTQHDQTVTVTGPRGSLTAVFPAGIRIISGDSSIEVQRPDDTIQSRSYHGLTRTLLANMVTGVTDGFTKKLELHGVGYRAALQGNDLVLSVGFSHPVVIAAPEGIVFKVEKNTISVSGNNNVEVGQIAAQIRQTRKPEPYKGKGIRYSGEFVRRKAGKAAKA